MNILTMQYYLLFMFFKKSSFKTYVEEKLSRYDVVDGYWRITYKTVIDDFLIIPKIKSRVQLSTGCSLRLNFLELIASL